MGGRGVLDGARGMIGYAILAAGCVTWAAIDSLSAMNPDGVAYVRIAGYWLTGDLDRAINGYWGPLLSWLIAAPLALHVPAQAAARAVMAASGVFFACTGLAFVRVVVTGALARAASAAVLLVIAVHFSVLTVTPDLLMAGWVLLAARGLATASWRTDSRLQAAVGAALALAYLSKAVALPASITVLASYAVWCFWARRAAWRPAAFTALALLILGAPWVAVISAHEHRLLFSTSGPINHALVSPAGSGEHPFMERYYDVPPGRITTWEDPQSSDYKDWSPFASTQNLVMQSRVALQNVPLILSALRGFDLGLFSALAIAIGAIALVLRRRWVGPPEAVAILTTAVFAGIYLPVYAGATRYFVVCAPLLMAMGFRAIDVASARLSWRLGATVVLTLSCLGATLPEAACALRGPATLALRDETRAIVAALQSEPGAAGMAGAGRDGRPVLHAAFALGRPFDGFQPEATNSDGLLRSKAAFLVLVRPSAALLDAAGRLGTAVPIGRPDVAIIRLRRP